MDILEGVEVFPFQLTLIAKDGPAFVRIDTRGHPGNRGYEKINERTFIKAVVPYLRGDWVDGMPLRLKTAPGAVAGSWVYEPSRRQDEGYGLRNMVLPPCLPAHPVPPTYTRHSVSEGDLYVL